MTGRLLLLACTLLADTASAELAFAKPIQEFHRSPQDKFVETRFAFRNNGSETITVKNVRTSCGCTTADLPKKVFAPGEEGDLTVKFNFGSRMGGQKKTIRVYSSDRGDEPTLLEMRVFIEDALTVSSTLVFWRPGEANTPKQIQFTGTAERQVKVTSVTSSNPRISAKLRTIKAGEKYAIEVQPADTTVRDGAEISVQTDYPADAPRTYKVFARIK